RPRSVHEPGFPLARWRSLVRGRAPRTGCDPPRRHRLAHLERWLRFGLVGSCPLAGDPLDLFDRAPHRRTDGRGVWMARLSAAAGTASLRTAGRRHLDRGGFGPLAPAALLDLGHGAKPPALRPLCGAHGGALDHFNLALQRHASEPALRPPLSRVAQYLAEHHLYPRGAGGDRSLSQHDHHLRGMGVAVGDPWPGPWPRRPP